MTIFQDMRSVERPRFFDGQQLYASDLDAITAFHQAMREEHNRNLHQPGVGNGFAVAGRRGDRQVTVQPGYALSGKGQEIVLVEDHIEPVPPVAAERNGDPVVFDLTVSYPADEDLEEAETREGVCLPRGVVRLRERPVFCWVRLVRDVAGKLAPVSEQDALDIQQARKIVLARAQVLECELFADLSVALRRTARPAQPPHIACGCTPVEWEPWLVEGARDVIGIRTPLVDTTSGSFRITPCYQARVAGERPLEAEGTGPEGSQTILILDLPAYVQNPKATGFECLVPLLGYLTNIPPEMADPVVAAAQEGWPCVAWMGVEG
jgi:hypothetical protein